MDNHYEGITKDSKLKPYKGSWKEHEGAYKHGDSAIENNEHDLKSNQGDSGIQDVQMGPKLSRVEKEYLIRGQKDYRDEENPMYNDTDPTWGAPDRF